MSESVPRGNRPANEYAEALLRQIRGWVKVNGAALAHAEANLSDALRAERLAVVEEIGGRVTAITEETMSAPTLAEIRTILDEVGVAGLTEEGATND